MMTRTEINMFPGVLKNRETRLGNRNRRGLAIAIRADELDRIQQATFRGPVIGDPKMRIAPRCVGARKFGFCVASEEEISPKRLTAVPWAARCMGCQEGLERETPETEFDRSLRAA
jgi:Prokaryotic dksA/traR C4-type zinc finger